jgi:basic membrane protein A
MRKRLAFSGIRRRLLQLGVGLAAAGLARPAVAQRPMRIGALFAGRIDDAGFMESGYRGLVAARDRLGVTIAWRAGVKPERDLLAAALRELAGATPDLVVAHGGQNNEAAKIVAAEFPNLRFVVTQGSVTGANLASYEVLQEESAFLAGALAGWTTKTGVVGHMSGIRVVRASRAAPAMPMASPSPIRP